MNDDKQTDKIRRKRNRSRKAAYLRFTTGIRQLTTIHRWKNILIAAYLLLAIAVWFNRGKLLFGLDSDFMLFPVFTMAVNCLVALLFTARLALPYIRIGNATKGAKNSRQAYGGGI